MIAAVSSATFLPGLILGIIIAIALMRAATGFQRQWGRPPWGIPPWGWLLIGLILGLIGVVLYLIAHATTKRSLTANAGRPAYGSAYPPPPVPPPPNAQTWAPPSGSPEATSPPPPSDQAPPPPQQPQ